MNKEQKLKIVESRLLLLLSKARMSNEQAVVERVDIERTARELYELFQVFQKDEQKAQRPLSSRLEDAFKSTSH